MHQKAGNGGFLRHQELCSIAKSDKRERKMNKFISNLLGWMKGTAIRDMVENTPECEEYREFARTFTPAPDADYQWFLSHATKEFELADDRMKELDSKADSLIRYLGAAEGILSLAFLRVADTKDASLLWVSIPTMLAFLAAILLASTSRSPALHPVFPATADFLLRYPNGHFAKYAARIAATTQIARRALREKAALVRFSYGALNIGLVWLTFGAMVYSLSKVF
jgi:hypothetical protein